MSSLSKVLVLFTLALSVSGLATPHVVRSPHGHHDLAARMAAVAPSPAVGPYGSDVRIVKPKKMRKRGDTGRCKAKTSSAAPSSSVEPTTPVAAVAAAPSSSSSTPEPEKTSSTPAPEPTTSEAPAPAPQPTTSEAPAPTTSTSSGNSGSGSGSSNSGSSGNLPSFMIGTQTGEGTFYGIGLGACGVTNSGDDRIAAVSHLLFDAFPGYDGSNPNNNPICGRSVTASYQGKSTTVTITDRCEGCALTDLDFSPRAFEDIADFAVGRIDGMTWVWN